MRSPPPVNGTKESQLQDLLQPTTNDSVNQLIVQVINSPADMARMV